MEVKVDTAGQYRLDIDFANGSGEARSLTIGAGLDSVTQEFAQTGGWSGWETQEVLLNLAAGKNSIKFATLADKDGPNIDQFDVTLVKAQAASPDTSKKDTVVKDSSVTDTTKTDSTASDKPKQDSTAKDSTKSAIPMLSGATMPQAIFSVSIYGVNGELVHKLWNVPQAMLRNTRELSRGLRAGIYLVQASAPGISKKFFIAVK